MSWAVQHSGDLAVHHLLDDLYEAVLTADRPRFNAHLDDEATMWETGVPHMMKGIGDLTEYRDQRDAGAPLRLDMLDATERVISVLDDVAIARYVLVARDLDGNSSVFRVSDVLRLVDGRWRIVHHHAEERPGSPSTSESEQTEQ